MSAKYLLGGFDGGKGCREIVGTEPMLRGLILRTVFFCFFPDLENLGEKKPCYLEIQRVTKIRDPSSSSRLEKGIIFKCD